MKETAVRSDWVGRTVDARFVLVQWLGGSEGSGVFLTELDGPGPQKATVKLIPALSRDAEERVEGWAAAKSLSHPHLIRVLESGNCQIDGVSLVYVVAEYGDEVLSQIIPERPLTPDETREMLGPVLDALTYLHAHGLVHGHLKPSNILVVNDQLKLSSDGLLTEGALRRQGARPRIYDAPESDTTAVSPAADVWSLGVTVVGALTQRPPAWDRSTNTEPAIPEALPQPFDRIARECLRPDRNRRCTLGDVADMLEGKVVEPRRPVPPPPPEVEEKPSAPARLRVVTLGIAFVVLVAIILALRTHRGAQAPAPQPDAPQQAAPAVSSAPQNANGATKGEVLNRSLPDIPERARATIHGTVLLALRVNVDANGSVSDAKLESSGPSQYFARLVLQSAHAWKFRPAEEHGQAVSSVWVLHYRLRRDATEITPVEVTP